MCDHLGEHLWVGRIRMVSRVQRVTDYWVGILCLLSLQCPSQIHSAGLLQPDPGKMDSITFSDFHGQIKSPDSPSSRDGTIYQ